MFFKWFNIILGFSSLIYFIMYALLAGLTNKFTYVWLLIAIVCIVLGIKSKLVLSMWGKLHIAVRIIIISLVSVVSVLIISVLAIVIVSGASVPDKGADYVIVLGAKVRGDVPSHNLVTRLRKACQYLEENKNTKVIVSGGKGPGENITEAEAMKRYLINKGIKEERIIMEDKSVNTDENIKFSKELISDKDSKAVIVTNNFHVYRSMKIAQKQGLNNIKGLGSSIRWYTVPNLYLREAIAVIKYYVCGQI